jgi:phospholipid/cholesterol/gamma-HCH transport system permease protein
MDRAIEHLGSTTIRVWKSFAETIVFSFQMVLNIFDRRVYNSASLSVLVNQIYFTSVEILPLFFIISIILGTLIMGLAFDTVKQFGLDRYLGNFLMGFAVTELSPFVTVLLLALRSGSAINTEIATMKVSRELATLDALHIDVNNYLFLPRIVGGIVSLVLLTGLFSIVLLTSGFLFSNIIFGMGLTSYSHIMASAISFSDFVNLLIKCATFGFFVTLIPIRAGLQASFELTSIPVSVLHGMIRVFIAIVLIEVLSLLVKSM